MRREHSEKRPGIEWKVADVFGMPEIESSSFDMVVDKAVIDSVLFRQPTNQRKALGETALHEIGRVLRDGGVYFVVTPRKRFRVMMPGLEKWCWIAKKTITVGHQDELVIIRSQFQAFSAERKHVFIQAFRKPMM